MYRILPPIIPCTRNTWLLLAPAIVYDRMQPIPRSGDVSSCTTLQPCCCGSDTTQQGPLYRTTRDVIHKAESRPTRHIATPLKGHRHRQHNLVKSVRVVSEIGVRTDRRTKGHQTDAKRPSPSRCPIGADSCWFKESGDPDPSREGALLGG